MQYDVRLKNDRYTIQALNDGAVLLRFMLFNGWEAGMFPLDCTIEACIALMQK